jgi:hypothetical protein
MGTRRLAALGTALVAAVLLVGCANASPSTVGSPGGSMSASPSGEPSAQPSGSPQPPFTFSPEPGKSGQAQPEQTISGQVEAGVERGCLILRDSTGTYQLLGGDPTIVYAGADVSLTGHVVTGVMSYCMQGKPFQITQARRL